MAEPPADKKAPLAEPPPRQPWEEPPPDGWASPLGGIGVELATLSFMAALVWGGVHLADTAQRLGMHRAYSKGLGLGAVVLLWLLVCVIVAWVLLYLWRRMGGFALLAAMLTDSRRLRRLRGRPPVWLDEPPADAPRVAHLSDLHVTETEDVRLVEAQREGGNARLRRLLAEPAVKQADLVLITGDITDRGTARAWHTFRELLDEAGLTERTLLVPGNHDLALVDPIERIADRAHRKTLFRHDRFCVVQLANLLKFAEAFSTTLGGRVGFVLNGREIQPFEDAFAAIERDVRPLLLRLHDEPVPAVRLRSLLRDRRALQRYRSRIEAARERLLSLFPVAVPLPRLDTVVFVLNSCNLRAHHPATNAIGRVGRAQYRRLDRLARFYGQTVRLVALHHHVVRRAEEAGSSLRHRLLAKLTVLGDPSPLAKLCRRHGIRAVLNGHRHLSYQLRLPNGTVLCAAPSSTLGDELAHDPRLNAVIYRFAAQAEAPTVGIHRQVVRLPVP